MPDNSFMPFGMTGIPGANPGGTNMAVPTAASNSTPAIGGASNPFLPQFPGGTKTPDITSSIPRAGGADPLNIFSGSNGGGPMPSRDQWGSDLKSTGLTSAQAMMLYNFMSSGAGFNSDVANALIQALNPQVQRGEADLLESFSSRGLRDGSPAAIGMGDYLSQVNLNEGQIMAGLYEQAVQNYMSVLLGPGSQKQNPSGVGDSMQWLQLLASIGNTSSSQHK